MARINLTQRRKMEENEIINRLSKLYDRVNRPNVEFRKRTVYPHMIKEIIPEKTKVNIAKNGEVIKTINVRRKSKCITGKNRLIF